MFSSGYTLGALTPPPGSPYSPIPGAQLEFLTKGFNSNIIIQQQEFPLSPKKPHVQDKRYDDKCCSGVKQKSSCSCSPIRAKFADNSSGCSRTNPIEWSPTISIKKEPGNPCQVAEITTSMSPVIKVEVTSPPSEKVAMGEVHISTGHIPPVVTTNGK